MFTDTKNLGHATTNSSASAAALESPAAPHPRPRPKGRLRKVLKPLLRLLTSKSAAAAAACATHPNNVNLNNAPSVRDICELSTALLEDYAAVIRKVSKVEPEPGAAPALAPATSPAPAFGCAGGEPAVISSASIEKPPPATCSGCAHGRNCQHAQSHRPQPPAVREGEDPLAEGRDVPVHFVRTDNGTFFWTNLQDKVDEDLLHAWLCHSLRQFPTEAVVY